MNIAIDPINLVPAMVPNKSSTKNTTTESQTPSSGKSILQHLVFFLVCMSKWDYGENIGLSHGEAV